MGECSCALYWREWFMKVQELIDKLKTLPPNYEITMYAWNYAACRWENYTFNQTDFDMFFDKELIGIEINECY